MAENVWLLQYLFYTLICFILAVIMKGWLGLACGVMGGFIIIGVIFILVNGGGGPLNDRGR